MTLGTVNGIDLDDYERVALKCARKAERAFVWSILDRDDYEQGARLALIDAAERFDPARGPTFQVFATICISRTLAKEANRMRCEGRIESDPVAHEQADLLASRDSERHLLSFLSGRLREIAVAHWIRGEPLCSIAPRLHVRRSRIYQLLEAARTQAQRALQRDYRLAAGAVLVAALAASCAGLKRTAATTTLGYSNGSGSTSSSFSGVGDHGTSHSSQELPFSGSGSQDSDWHAWSIGIQPLAWLDDTEEHQLDALHALLAASQRNETGAGSDGERSKGAASEPDIARPAPALPIRTETAADGTRLYFQGDALVAALDPLEPMRAAEPKPVEPAPKEPTKSGVPGEVWSAAAALALAVAGFLANRRYQWIPPPAPKASKETRDGN